MPIKNCQYLSVVTNRIPKIICQSLPLSWNWHANALEMFLQIMKLSIDQSVYRDAIAPKLAQSPMKISYSKRRAPIFQLMPSTMHRCQGMYDHGSEVSSVQRCLKVSWMWKVSQSVSKCLKGVSKCLRCGKWCPAASSWGSWPGLGLESSPVLIWPRNPSCLFCSCEFSLKWDFIRYFWGDSSRAVPL